MTALCRFDLLIQAAAQLREEGLSCNVLLVGDGPAAPALKRMAEERGQPVHFFGPCYDEQVISQLIYRADLTVSPGKVGLTAMHSLQYGTPVITHDNDDEQMPEVEAIVNGVTGARFRQNDASDLALVIRTWLSSDRDRAAVRAACRAEIAAHWNPHVQATTIEQSIMKVLRHD